MFTFIHILIIFALFTGLFVWQRKGASLSYVIFAGLVLGTLYGVTIKAIITPEQTSGILSFLDLTRLSYIRLLKLIVIPLVFISILSAILKMEKLQSLGKISFSIVGVLLATTAVSAIIGIFVVNMFQLDASSFTQGAQETKRIATLVERGASLQEKSFTDMIVAFVPENIFADLAQTRSTSTIAVVLFSLLLGIASLRVIAKFPEYTSSIQNFVEVANKIVHELVRFILAFTPYGIFAVIARMVIITDVGAIVNLAQFVIASYIGLALIFVMHLTLVTLTGVSPIRYLKNIWPAIIFAFSSRSSAATIPLTIQVQTEGLKNNPAVANFSASIGATLGQNGCAGLYPAMLAVMVAPSLGIDPLNIGFLAQLLLVVTIGSFGVAGVGGGATSAALIVFGTLGLPIEIVGLLISVEPLIDMGRTAANVSGAITSGTVTSRLFTPSGDADNTSGEPIAQPDAA